LSVLSFGILGLTQISVDGEERLISATRQRELLAVLLLRASRVVAKDELVERLWPGVQPPGVENALHTHVRRLRKNLGLEAGGRIVTRYPGYLLSIEPGELDLDVFETLRGAAEHAARAQDWREAYGASTAAPARRRGEPLLDVPRLHRRDEEVLRLEEARGARRAPRGGAGGLPGDAPRPRRSARDRAGPDAARAAPRDPGGRGARPLSGHGDVRRGQEARRAP
jgi:DNA-binding winged helix-turn-helix (wHTH) protein